MKPTIKFIIVTALDNHSCNTCAGLIKKNELCSITIDAFPANCIICTRHWLGQGFGSLLMNIA